jgi:hypothetical protein
MARKTVQVDTSSVTGKDVGAVTSTTLSATIADNPNRVSVLINCFRGSDSRATAVSRDGVAYTMALRSTANDGCQVEIWYQVNPDADTGNITVTYTGTTDGNSLLGHVALYDVDTSDPVNITDVLTGSGTSISNSFTATENNCVAIDGQFNTSIASGSQASGQTLIRKRSSNDSGGCSYETDIDAQSETMGWTGFDVSAPYSHGVVVFQGALPVGNQFVIIG